MSLASLVLDRRLLVVTGKGGVGKTSVASALALLASARGRRVLLCDLDAKGDALDALSGVGAPVATPLTYRPRELHRGLFAMVMDPEESLKEYLRLNLRLPLVTRIGALSTVFDFLANAAPGVREIVTIGKVAYDVRERSYDLVVVDATATGHVVGQLRAPQSINELVGAGLIRSQTRWIQELLADPEVTQLIAVTTLEELPVVETTELLDAVRRETPVAVGAVIVNRALPSTFTADETELFTRIATPPSAATSNDSTARRAEVVRTCDTDVATLQRVFDAVSLAEGIRDRRAQNFDILLQAAQQAPLVVLPQLFDSAPGFDTTRTLADHLRDELGLGVV